MALPWAWLLASDEGSACARWLRAIELAAPKAEGLPLHLSSSSSTGYRGVWPRDGRFQAQYRVDGRIRHVGAGFATAVEAAVAYARAVGRHQLPAPPAPHAPPAPPAVATEAEGLPLHLSSSSSTGYRGVYTSGGRFMAQRRVDGLAVCLGTGFATAVEAAVAYARAVAEAEAEESGGPATKDVLKRAGFEEWAAAEGEPSGKRQRRPSGKLAEARAAAKELAQAAARRAVDRTRRQHARTTPASSAGTGVKLEVAAPRAPGQPGAGSSAGTGVKLEMAAPRAPVQPGAGSSAGTGIKLEVAAPRAPGQLAAASSAGTGVKLEMT
ncbi:hypothetical protein EMIHUDRAFT_98343 [Emiliania huxleyi CCMP1516]|uniref:AP2/ERF domain-containing protein n=2 Tax=Emiliania huxleyi TaxID=2903 RepID=A0A0D3KMH1_EMIH1|nr:hypothetical protein EMIHUDRAFT_98343 [Emiliania huxleyi CCMP1516]EOD36956.1 hypothetical protein EMIHUDRAFT_98343 [Emiliania huxleyi CCMP1516]|eukprot:XP_005789385.1 hypothetical protein EMIHUDRAFT_98343 [Emiliania huxleyi CCMP1516]